MATHLAPDEILADYACGTTSPGTSLLLAAHLTQAPEARRRLREFERIGGTLLVEEPPAEVSEDALDRALAAIDRGPEPADTGRRSERPHGPLPRPLAERIGIDFDEIPWKFRLPGVSAFDLAGFGDEKVQLLRARPGATVPQHTHKGFELTLILQGCMLDQGVEYHVGDVAVNDESDDHRPTIIGDEICYCLIVQQGELHFTGTFSRLFNLLGR